MKQYILMFVGVAVGAFTVYFATPTNSEQVKALKLDIKHLTFSVRSRDMQHEKDSITIVRVSRSRDMEREEKQNAMAQRIIFERKYEIIKNSPIVRLNPSQRDSMARAFARLYPAK